MNNIRIGGSKPGEGNVIFPMEEGGIIIGDIGPQTVAVKGNYIGVNRTGRALINKGNGPQLSKAYRNKLDAHQWPRLGGYR